MSVLSDILDALKMWPKWKAVEGAPERITALEARVKALEEGRAAQSAPGPMDCYKCGARMRVDREVADSTFGDMGIKVHFLKCDACGTETDRQYQPGKGYL
jgi:hypothetical protein